MQFNQLVARMSRDKRLDAYRSQNLEHLYSEALWPLVREAQRTVLKDTKCRLKEQQFTLTAGDRDANLPDDFLVLEEARYRLSTDDSTVEGSVVQIVDASELF